MATNFKAKRQKLYFDVTFNKTVTNNVVTCTQFSAGTPGDRFGNLMASLAALTGSAPQGTKTRGEVTAFYVPNVLQYSANGVNATSPAVAPFECVFCQPTGKGSNLGVKLLPYLTVGTLTPLNNLSGHSALYSITSGGAQRHFGVKVRRRGISAVAISVAGTLYVQRQHSIEV